MKSPSFQDMAENINNASYGDEMLGVLFYLRTVEDVERTAAEGRRCYCDREYVKIIVPGDRHNIIDRPVQITGNAQTDDRLRFAEQYERFRQRLAQPIHDGTPLSVWPGIGSALAEELKYLNIHTVEQMAGIADTYVNKIPRGHELKRRAAEFVAAMADAAQVNKLQAALAERDERINALEAAIADQAERIERMLGAHAQTPPKKRHRRTKAEIQAALEAQNG